MLGPRVYLNLPKAIDTIGGDHTILLQTLSFMILGAPLKLFQSYLRNLSEYVQYKLKVFNQSNKHSLQPSPTASDQRRKNWEVCASRLGAWHL